jgi:trans-2,3-dihydro-3-hydroxyanthranilate isomerase
MPTRIYDFVQLDVFTNRALEGNQLAVFPDARGLSDDEMLRIAKEMNLSETTYILPRDSGDKESDGIKVRIFTVNEELPFAGHPTLGTAWYLKQQHPDQNEIVLDLPVGKVPVRFERRDDLWFGEMRQVDPKFGDMHPHHEVASVLGLKPQDLDENLPIQTVSTGMNFTMVPFRDVAALENLNVGWGQMAPYLSRISGFFYFVARVPRASNQLRARMIFYNGEDPATGSAAGCCTAWAVKHGVLGSDTQGMIEQGREMRRPSLLYIRATKQGDTVTNIRVGGHVVHLVDAKIMLS